MKRDRLEPVAFDWARPYGTPNARFWIWRHSGWVKLTIRHGQTLSAATYWENQEAAGYGLLSETWEHTGKTIRNECATSCADCDGRHDQSATYECPIGELRPTPFIAADDLASSWHYPVTTRLAPPWRQISAEQRDHYAEGMGY